MPDEVIVEEASSDACGGGVCVYLDGVVMMVEGGCGMSIVVVVIVLW